MSSEEGRLLLVIFLSRLKHSLQHLPASRRAVPIPNSDRGCQYAFHYTPVKGGQDTQAEAGLLQPPQKREALVGLLYDNGCVGGPRFSDPVPGCCLGLLLYNLFSELKSLTYFLRDIHASYQSSSLCKHLSSMASRRQYA